MIDMPKLQSPFKRETVDGKYVCVPVIDDAYRWIFTDKAIATEKLDGTNTSVMLREGCINAIFNRTNYIDIWSHGGQRFYNGIVAAMERKYFYPKEYQDTQIFGELIGEDIQGNPYNLDGQLWMPFKVILNKYTYKFWSGFLAELQDKDELYAATSNLFKGLWSLFKRSRAGNLIDKNLSSENNYGVNETVPFHSSFAAEGIVFYHKDHLDEMSSDWMCKLRRDMFDWYPAKNGRAVREEK